MDTLLEAIGIVLEIYFGFRFPNGSSIGDSLRAHQLRHSAQLFGCMSFFNPF